MPYPSGKPLVTTKRVILAHWVWTPLQYPDASPNVFSLPLPPVTTSLLLPFLLSFQLWLSRNALLLCRTVTVLRRGKYVLCRASLCWALPTFLVFRRSVWFLEGIVLFFSCYCKDLLWLYVYEYFVCMCVGVTCSASEARSVPRNWSFIRFWVPRCMLGTESGSSARAASALNLSRPWPWLYWDSLPM